MLGLEIFCPDRLIGGINAFFKYVYGCFTACIFVHCRYAWRQRNPEEGIRSPWIIVTNGCEIPCGYWKSNMGPLQEELVLLSSESPLQPNKCIITKIF